MRSRRKGKQKETLNKDEVSEDYCFVCKDGGDIRICDYGNCLKGYHPHCVGKDDSFLHSDVPFICSLHTCFICKRSSHYQCFCCPNYPVCRGCIRQAEFVQVKQTKGFCNNCLRLAMLVEKNVDVNSDGEEVDFGDTETREFLFKGYWEIIKEKEGLTLVNLQKASYLLKRGLNCAQESDSEKIPDEDHSSDEDFLGDNDDDESIYFSDLKGQSNRAKPSSKKCKSNRKAYVGWGSKELIMFLSSIGKDTSKSLDQFGVSEVVKQYIQQRNLFQKDKKKNVMCDDKLWNLFRKRKLKYNKIHSLLETHIAANATSEDESPVSSGDDDKSITKKKARTMGFEANTSKRTSEKSKKCFASLIDDNIKLIYLRRSLIVDLLKNPDTFEQKVVGCFVRFKNDRSVYGYHMSQKFYQLGQVTGIKKSSEEYKIWDTCTNMLLCVSSSWADIKISMLSDDDFEEEECEDLRLLVKKEHLKRHTIVEFEEKLKSVHHNIVNHWIDKELVRLERLIEMANEKGWRKEMHEYIDKKQLLRTPGERQRLLEEVPQVIPDTEEEMQDTEVEVTADCSCQENRGATGQVAPARQDVAEERFKDLPTEPPSQVAGMSIAVEGATMERATPYKFIKEEAPEGAFEQGAAAYKVAMEGMAHVAAPVRVPQSPSPVSEHSAESSTAPSQSTYEPTPSATSSHSLTKSTTLDAISDRLRQNPYERERSCQDRRFWSDPQRELYTQLSSVPVFDHRFVDWVALGAQVQFDVLGRYRSLGLEQFASQRDEWTWSEDVVRLFYATLFVDSGRTRLEFMMGTEHRTVSKEQFEEALSIERADESVLLHMLAELTEDEARRLYTVPHPDVRKVKFLRNEVDLIDKMNCRTLLPRAGKREACTVVSLHLARAISQGLHFDVADFLISEMSEAAGIQGRSLPYAPFIMHLLRHSRSLPVAVKSPCTVIRYKPVISRRLTLPAARNPDDADAAHLEKSHDSSWSSSSQEQSEESSSLRTLILDQFQHVHLRLDILESRMDTMGSWLDRFSSEFAELRTQVAAHRPPLQTYQRKRARLDAGQDSGAAATTDERRDA